MVDDPVAGDGGAGGSGRLLPGPIASAVRLNILLLIEVLGGRSPSETYNRNASNQGSNQNPF